MTLLNSTGECHRDGEERQKRTTHGVIALYLAACTLDICLPQLLDVSDLASRDRVLAQMMHLVSAGPEGKSLGYVSYFISVINATMRKSPFRWCRRVPDSESVPQIKVDAVQEL